MSKETEHHEESMEALRSRMDADARFHRVLSGYEPEEVRQFLEEMKRTFALQAKAAKREQEILISDLSAARTEIDSRNCAIKALKEALTKRESELSTANMRISTLIQNVKQFETEREGYERLRAAMDGARAASARTQTLETEVQQLRSTLTKAASLLEVWKAERTRLFEENEALQQEINRLRVDRATASVPNEPVLARASAPAIPAQVADHLADTFAEAYTIIQQFRNQQPAVKESAPQSSSPPRMQVLRPDGTIGEHSINK